ncbi:MAG: hypothetical protein WKG07_15400 [Hymenobacter sp.]
MAVQPGEYGNRSRHRGTGRDAIVGAAAAPRAALRRRARPGQPRPASRRARQHRPAGSPSGVARPAGA